jgi:hypothetical protein
MEKEGADADAVAREVGGVRRKRDGGRSAGMCTVSRKTEQEDRVTRGLRGKCFFVTVSKNEGGTTADGRGKAGV